MDGIRILGTGYYVPPKVMSNDDIVRMGVDTSDEWIVRRTGIKERRMAEPDVVTSDLALEASRKALEMAGMAPEEIQLIVMGTITADTCCPAGANCLQAKLGTPKAITFDVAAACSGFVFALNVAEQYLRAGTVTNALVVSAEIMTRTIDWSDRSSAVFWGDGAGAAVLSTERDGHALLSSHIHSDGAGGNNLLMPGGGSATTPISYESVDKRLHYVKLIEASNTFKVAVRRFIEAIRECADHNDVAVEDIRWFIPHQANIRMFTNISGSLDIPMERFYMTIQKYGNISSASCAIAFAEAVEDGSIQPGDLVCIPVFGGGLTWGSALIRW